MKLVFSDAAVLRKLIDGISVLVDEAEFVVTADGVALKATDPSQISLVDFLLPKSAFKEFVVDKPVKIGVDLNYFSQVFGRAKSSDSVELSFDADTSKLAVIFSGSAKRKFLVPLLDLALSDLPVPKIEFDAEAKLRAEGLQESFKDAALISTHVVLAIEDNSFVVRANSSKGTLENVYSAKDKSLVSLKASGNCKSMFPLDYLSNIVKAASSETEVVVRLKSNAPTELEYSLGGAKMRYFLAPRIEDEA